MSMSSKLGQLAASPCSRRCSCNCRDLNSTHFFFKVCFKTCSFVSSSDLLRITVPLRVSILSRFPDDLIRSTTCLWVKPSVLTPLIFARTSPACRPAQWAGLSSSTLQIRVHMSEEQTFWFWSLCVPISNPNVSLSCFTTVTSFLWDQEKSPKRTRSGQSKHRTVLGKLQPATPPGLHARSYKVSSSRL